MHVHSDTPQHARVVLWGVSCSCLLVSCLYRLCVCGAGGVRVTWHCACLLAASNILHMKLWQCSNHHMSA